MARLYLNQLSRSGGIYYLSQDAAYPATNALLQSITRQYRTANLVFPTGFEYFGFDLAGASKISCYYLHDHNFEAEYAQGYDAVALGGNTVYSNFNPTRGLDRFGRRRSIFKNSGFVRSMGHVASINNSGSATAELTFTCTAQGPAGNKYTYWSIRSPSYTILSGDVLRYDVWIDPNNPADQGNSGAGAIDIELTSSPLNGRSVPLPDANGLNINDRPNGSRGTWITRTISLTPAASKVISLVHLVNENDTPGTYVCRYRNMRITDATGSTERVVIWKGGVTQLNQDGYSLNYYGQTITTQGSPTDGLSYWRVGALYAMQDVVDIVAPQYGLEIETVFPQVSTELPNGVTAVASIGTRYDKIRGTFMVSNSGSMTIANLLTAMRSGVCILDLELPDAPHRMWPLRIVRASDRESLTYPSHTEIDFEAVEVV